MMDKNNKIYAVDIKAGDEIKEQPFILKKVYKKVRQGQELYFFVVGDKSGEITCMMYADYYRKEYEELVGGAVLVSGFPTWINDHVELKIKEIKKGEQVDTNELYVGVSEEEIKSYKDTILNLISRMQDTPEKSIVKTLYTDDFMDRLGILPGSTQNAVYRGGMLVECVSVTTMALSSLNALCGYNKGPYEHRVSRTRLLAASFVYFAALSRLYTPYPFKKTSECLYMGFQTVLGLVVSKAIEKLKEEGVDIDFESLQPMLHIAVSAVEKRIKAMSGEAVIFGASLYTFEECDQISKAISLETDVNSEDKIVFSEKVARYIAKDY